MRRFCLRVRREKKDFSLPAIGVCFSMEWGISRRERHPRWWQRRCWSIYRDDLTTLSRRHGGKFPEAYVSKTLRNGVKLPAHGPAEMPVWGVEFEAKDGDKTQVESRIRNLTNYIKSRQTK